MTGFNMDAGGYYALSGYVGQMTKTVKTSAYMDAVLSYTHTQLSKLFDVWMDIAAEANPHAFHHVYEWPTRFGNYKETVGNPAWRLWRHTLTGHGRNKVASFRFLASHRPTPVDPILLEPGPSGKTVKQGVHIFVWKAPAMEYAVDIEVNPRLAKYLAYVYGNQADKQGQDYGRAGHVESASSPGTGVQFSIGPVNFEAGGGKMKHRFTNAFIAWWQVEAGREFEERIRPKLEQDLVDEKLLDRAIRRGNRASKPFGITAQASRHLADFEEAAGLAKRALAAKQNQYWRAAEQRRRLIYGEDED